MIQKYLVQTNIWVALCFTCLVVFFQLNLYQPYYSVWGIAFFGTLAIYNFTRISHWRKVLASPSQYSSQIILALVGCLGAFVCVLLRGFDLKTFLYLFVLGFLSFCYSLPFSGLGLRTIPFLKLFLIAFVWAGSSIGLLLVVHQDLWEQSLLFLSVFFFVMGITIPFDIRDALSDTRDLKTIPQVIGFKTSKLLAVGCLILSGILFYLEYPNGLFFKSWLLTILIGIILVRGSNPRKREMYFSFWMEALSLLPLLIYSFAKIFC